VRISSAPSFYLTLRCKNLAPPKSIGLCATSWRIC
jgi:hypothetical protein